MTDVPRVVVSAPMSGHGKTAVTAGLLAAFNTRDLRVSAFKTGADQVDAAYLGMACGRAGRNLDPALTGPELMLDLFTHGSAGSQLAVVEGGFGLFDSIHPRSCSTATVAQRLRAPVILVVDASSLGQSLAPLVRGFVTWDEPLWLAGVILTRVSSDRHEKLLRDSLDEINIPVLGAIRRTDAALPPRRNGMLPVTERSAEAVRAIRRLGETVLEHVDVDRVLAIARSAPRLPERSWDPAGSLGHAGTAQTPLVAVAGGAFSTFSYTENIEMLQAAGADVTVFDPLRDEEFPAGTRAVVFGGGFPEWYVEELAGNVGLGAALARLAADGAPIAVESAGLTWLSDELDGRPMAKVLRCASRTRPKSSIGYRTATAVADNVLFPSGATITGYKHHRITTSPRAGEPAAWSWPQARAEGYAHANIHASHLNLNWAVHPATAARFVSRIRAHPPTGA